MLDCVMNTTTERRAGIYMIRNSVTGGRYYGSSVNLRTRAQSHASMLRSGKHRNAWLQNAWNKYGEDAFTFTVLAVLERSEVLASEGRLLSAHVGTPGCMNIARDAAAPMAGRSHTASTRAQMSATACGRVVTWGDRISAAKKGVPNPSARGRQISDETRERIAAAKRGRRVVWSEERRASQSARNKDRVLSPESRAKISAAHKGRVKSDAERANLSAGHMGHVRSPEARAKQSASARAYFANRRIDRLVRFACGQYAASLVAA